VREKVLVMGGGIIGLSCAFELARRGLEVTVFDSGNFGQAASGASAGMLGALFESVDRDDSLAAIFRRSLELWPEFAQRLSPAPQEELDFDRSGTLVLDDGDLIDRLVARAEAWSQPWRTLSLTQAQQLVPGLNRSTQRLLHLPDDLRVDSGQVCAALVRRLSSLEVKLLPNTRISEVRPSVTGVEVTTPRGRFKADRLLVAAGAWSGAIPGLPFLPIEARRGQMLAFSGVDWPFHGSIRAAELYAVRRRGDRLLIGATVEDVGFVEGVNADGQAQLEEFARRNFTDLAQKPVVSRWSGLRPLCTKIDHRPLLGWIGDGIFVATGHFRNGILLAPFTAALVADLLTENSWRDSVAESAVLLFRPDRQNQGA
jgi:glycine oxidase